MVERQATDGGVPPSEHIVRAFDEELAHLRAAVSEMGGLVEAQLADAIRAVTQRDIKLAERCRNGDQRVDDYNERIESQALRMLALRQPMAVDLRQIVSAVKIASDLERMGDHAANIAKRSLSTSRAQGVPLGGLARMGRMVQALVKDILDAFCNQQVDKAEAAWRRDEEVDELHSSLFREFVTYMMEDPRNISACAHLLFVAKNLERIGDHATNIAETVIFLHTGHYLEDARPKGDVSSLTALEPPPDAAAPKRR